jgi:hypothetical protein
MKEMDFSTQNEVRVRSTGRNSQGSDAAQEGTRARRAEIRARDLAPQAHFSVSDCDRERIRNAASGRFAELDEWQMGTVA